MAENVVAEVRKLLQDLIAPDIKALTYRMDGLQKQLELSEKSIQAQLDAMNAQLIAFRSEQNAFRSEMSAFRAEMRSEFQAQRTLVQNEVLRETSPIRERLASLEASHA